MNSLMVILAFRNLARNRVRTTMVIAMIASSLTLLMYFQGFMDGIIEQMTKDTVRSETSDITIYGKKYRKEKDLNNRLTHKKYVLKKLSYLDSIEEHFERLEHDAMIASPYYSQGIKVIGLESEKEKDDFILSTRIKEGDYSFPNENAIWIGHALAEKLGTGIQRKLVLTVQDSKGEIIGEAFRVTAIIQTNNPKIDRASAFISLTKAQALFNVPDITQLSIKIHDQKRLREVRDTIQDEIGNHYEVFTWRQLFPSLQFMETATQSYIKISYVIMFIIMMIGFVGVIMMSIMERVREFGIMMAIGHKFKQVSLIVFWESLMMSFFGFLIGTTLGFGLLYIVNQTGVNLNIFGQGFEQFGIASIIYPPMKIAYCFTPLLAVLITSILSIIWPLRILYKLKPIQSIQFN